MSWVDYCAVNLNLDVSVRYAPVVRWIRRRCPSGTAILDVGCGPAGVGHYLKRVVVGVDKEFIANRRSRFLAPVISSAMVLPFRDGSFDVTVAMDVLEHIPPEERNRFIQELFRVSRCHIVLGVPSGPLAARQDRELASYYFKQHGTDYTFLTEHLEYGLPTPSELENTIARATGERGRSLKIHAIGNANLTARNIYMRLVLHRTLLAKALYVLLGFLQYIPPVVNSGPSYRVIYFCELV